MWAGPITLFFALVTSWAKSSSTWQCSKIKWIQRFDNLIYIVLKISRCYDIIENLKAVLPFPTLLLKDPTFLFSYTQISHPPFFIFIQYFYCRLLSGCLLGSALHFQRNKAGSFIQLSFTAQNDII